jgi:GIY-YIG catalytic domain-containing protein
LSPKINKKIGSFKRQYSTYSDNLSNLDEIGNNKPIKFDSLEQGCEQIKYKYLGVSGVYKLTNKNDLSRFYIGSSNNLARRMEEYNKLTKGLRNPHSLSELEISKTPALKWSLEFLYITTPQLSLVYEQYTIILFKPTINSNYKVIPRINPQWIGSVGHRPTYPTNLDHAISVIEKLLSLFILGSEGYNRLYVFLQTFKTANNLKFEDEDIDNRYYCFLVFVYEFNSPDKEPVIYSSINRALKGLQISYSTLLDHIDNYYIYKSNFILSFEPIAAYTFEKYTEKPVADNQLRKHIIVYNLDNEIVAEFKSGREMAKYFQIDGKVARAAIAKGEYQDFLLIVKNVSYRKAIYVFDSKTHELIDKLESMSRALKYAKVNFYTLKSLIESGNSYQGKIYSYKDKL